MGTGNFVRPKLAKSYYAICMNYEDGDKTIAPDETECDIVIDNIRSEFKNEFKSEFEENDDWYDTDRNYPSRYIGKITTKDFHIKSDYDLYFYFIIDIISTAGYYEGATLDYVVQIDYPVGTYANDITIKGEKDKNFDEIANYILENFDEEIDEKDYKKLLKSLKNELEKQYSNYEKRIEKVFKKVSEHELERVGAYSNGNVIYKKK